MIPWYLAVRKLISSLQTKAFDALEQYRRGGKDAAKVINSYMNSDLDALWKLWQEKEPDGNLGNLGRHIHFGMDNDYKDILRKDLPELEQRVDAFLSEESSKEVSIGFENLLHPIITKKALPLYRDGHLREAVLNSITAVFDYIRNKSGLVEDGDRLVTKALSLSNPLLVLSELETDSGQNDQKGFLQIFSGAYLGIRNPKAHSLDHNLTETKAAQYLIFASLLARRIQEAKKP